MRLHVFALSPNRLFVRYVHDLDYSRLNAMSFLLYILNIMHNMNIASSRFRKNSAAADDNINFITTSETYFNQ